MHNFRLYHWSIDCMYVASTIWQCFAFVTCCVGACARCVRLAIVARLLAVPVATLTLTDGRDARARCIVYVVTYVCASDMSRRNRSANIFDKSCQSSHHQTKTKTKKIKKKCKLQQWYMKWVCV